MGSDSSEMRCPLTNLRRRAQTEQLSGRRLSLLVLVLTLVLGAKSDKWVQLAEHDLTFAKGLASEGVRFGPRFMDEVIKGRVFEFGCNPKPSQLVGLDDLQIRQINLYSEQHCNPWSAVWAEELWPCEGQFAPTWCKTGDEKVLASHLKIGPYFDRLTETLRSRTDALEIYNIMSIIADRLGDDVLRDYPQRILGMWTSTAVSVFLQKAGPGEALGIGWLLSWAPYGDKSTIAKAFRSYLDQASDATQDERRLLGAVVAALDGQSLPGDVRSVLEDRFGPRSPPPPSPPPPDRTDPESISLLGKRVDSYYGQIRDRAFDATWDLVALDYREAYDRESYVRTDESIWRRTKVLKWSLKSIRIRGDMAQVTSEVRCEERVGLFKNIEALKEKTSFWVFENDNWYNMVKWPRGWKDDQAIEVPLPQKALDDKQECTGPPRFSAAL